ncbi:hypothetical protein ACFOZ5_18275 [Marinobacter lacisalsi]|uniref:Helicase XPB/Ssl2 N-terminal domain-containing protein n=1 Tax=Marinobacter lacisalsi TaxID=475979 RepID=A0ABV8QL88_9GAMM
MKLEIQHLDNHYQLPSGMTDPAGIRRRLDRTAQEELAQALARLLEKELADRPGLYCIRQLDITLLLASVDWTRLPLASSWAEALHRALQQALQQGNRDQVRYYASEADFSAHFMADLLQGEAWSQWPYQRLRHWRTMPDSTVITELLLARPHWLGTVADHLGKLGHLKALVDRVATADIRQIFRRGFLAAGDEDTLARPLSLTAFEPLAQEDLTVVDTVVAGYWQAAFTLLCQVSRRQQELQPERVLAIQQWALIRRGWQAVLLQEPGVTEPGDWLIVLSELCARQPSPELLSLRQLILQYQRHGEGKDDWADLITDTAPERPATGHRAVTPLTSAGRSAMSQRTAFAGSALLLPLIRDDGVYRTYSPLHLYLALTRLAGGELTPLARSESALWQLLLEIPEADKPHQLEHLPPWPNAAADDPERELADDLAARLRARLPGFRHSSHDYLRRQFLQQPGQLWLSDSSLELSFDELPLSMVVRMAGLSGDQGRLPWLGDRLLTLHLPGAMS